MYLCGVNNIAFISVMIIDSIENLSRYASLNPRFAVVAEFLRDNDLSKLTVGKHTIQGDDIYVNIQEAPVKSRQQARFETHCQMVDIQVPISSEEEHGWTPASELPSAAYDANVDMTLHDPAAGVSPETLASTYFTLRPGQFAIYFPTDGHAPAVTATGLRKAIFKVRN